MKKVLNLIVDFLNSSEAFDHLPVVSDCFC